MAREAAIFPLILDYVTEIGNILTTMRYLKDSSKNSSISVLEKRQKSNKRDHDVPK